MTREWKPGDVALIGFGSSDERAMWINDAWHVAGGRSTTAAYSVKRALVVIDPEDREQVERLTSALEQFITSGADYADGVQAALHGFANPTPPKPDEPQGLGAVVEDSDGERWVQFSAKTGNWWRNHQGRNLRWHNINAVRVLSEGVS